MSEAQLAAKVRKAPERDGWTVYEEVLCPYGKRTVDIYAVREHGRGLITWAIECKRAFGLAVLEQAHYWRAHAHYSSIATPPLKTDRAKRFAAELLRVLEVGMIEVGRSVTLSREGRERPSPTLPDLKKASTEPGRAGTQGTSERTRQREIMAKAASNLVCSVGKPMSCLKVASSISHHYRATQNAALALASLAKAGKISKVKLAYFRGEPYLKPNP